MSQDAFPLHLLVVCPSFWQLRQRIGFGKYSSTFTLYHPILSELGGRKRSKEKSMRPVGRSIPSVGFLNLKTSVTPCDLISLTISLSGTLIRKGA